MEMEGHSDLSMNVSTFFLKNIGLWIAENSVIERRRKLLLVFTLWSAYCGMLITSRDLYFTWLTNGNIMHILLMKLSVTWGIFYMVLLSCYQFLSILDVFYVLANTLGGVIIMVKINIIVIHKEEFINLIVYMQQNFWNVSYDPQEKEILDGCRKICTFFVCSVTTVGMCALLFYILTPFIAQNASNESERMLPFNMWLNLPLSRTPYYEIAFLLQVISLYYVGLCYFCFDNVFCIMAVHLAGQFRILRYRLTNLCDVECQISDKDAESLLKKYVSRSYQKFREYVQQHQALIDFCDKLENVYTMIILGQVLIFSGLICLFGYQVLDTEASYSRRAIFIFLLMGAMSLLFMFTYSCNCIIEDSEKVAIGAYSAQWTTMPIQKIAMMLRNDLIMVIGRSRRVCCLTANGFFPVSLETYTTILSTAVSYFTLLRNNTTNENET